MTRIRGGPARRRGRALLAVAGTLLALTPAAAAASPGTPAQPAAPTQPASPVGPVRPAAVRLPAGDEVVTGSGDVTGYHLFAATAAGGWAWRPLATIAPGGDQPWIGSQCLTGDGRQVVAVVAPWHANNDLAAADRGALAYLVDAHTGVVRPLVSGVTLHYFNPGCGTGARVALTRFLGADQEATQVLVADTGTGRIVSTSTVTGQVTLAIPVDTGVVAVRGRTLVRLDGDRVRILGSVPGSPYELQPNDAGGADLLVAESADTAGLWRLAGSRLSRLGGGRLGTVKLFGGRAGRTTVVGATTARPGALRQVAAPPGAPAVAASLDGGTVLTAGTAGTAGRAALSVLHPTAHPGAVLTRTLPAPAAATGAAGVVPAAAPAPHLAALPTALAGEVAAIDSATPATSAGPAVAGPTTVSPLVQNTTPTCAIPRDDPSRLVPQPNPAQVDWAIQQGVRGLLTAADGNGRPAGAFNLGLVAYGPSTDFPADPLDGAPAGTPVPPQVVQAVYAQESNWNQASWHALPGLAGNPLVADYYGWESTGTIDYSQADCGYGLSQVTDPMTVDSTYLSEHGKMKVAVDYAENVAIGITFLVDKWNQLYQDGITANDADPAKLENWYLALWAYNSGINPQASTGNTTGCTPTPTSCHDPDGNWGLGWSNNPINPDYPADREPFLRTTYADAAHPGDWPYQEKVFGWMYTPLKALDGSDSYLGAVAPLVQPGRTTFCSLSANHCDPNTAAPYCQRSDFHCWWHQHVDFADCSVGGGCQFGRFTVDSTAHEPSASNPHPPACNLDTGQIPATGSLGATVVVDDEPTDLNLAGCPTSPGNWTNGGIFTATYGVDGTGGATGQIDWHQLGAGFGGHFWFTHTEPPGDTAQQVTGTWTPDLPAAGLYNVKAFVPDTGAVAAEAAYQVALGDGTTQTRTIDQHIPANRWIGLGDFLLHPGASVSLTNLEPDGNGSTDIAFDAIAFVPVQGTLVQHSMDMLSIFNGNQNLGTGSPSWLAGPFENDDTLRTWANGLLGPVLALPTCTGTPDANCVPAGTRAVLQSWSDQVATEAPATWLAYANPTPPNPLTPQYLRNLDNFKVLAGISVDFLARPDGTIDPGSVDVTAQNLIGDTRLPDFITELPGQMRSDYGITPPDLSYSAVNLNSYQHTATSNHPLASGQAPARAEMPWLVTPSLVDGGSCVSVADIAGGEDGWKPMIADDGVRSAAADWANRVRQLADNGQAPAALADLVDEWRVRFFKQPGPLPTVDVGPVDLRGSLFWYAPPIWIEPHVKVCANGSVLPDGGVDPVTNRQTVGDGAYMPDLYVYVDNQMVDGQGAPSAGPIATGDFVDFSVPPWQHRQFGTNGDPSPWNVCYIGTAPLADGIDFISRRDGMPWNLEPPIVLPDPNQLSTGVTVCDRITDGPHFDGGSP